MPELALDLLLGLALLWLAWRVLSGPDLFTSVILFIVFGLILSLVWARLAAPDIALAEAAIGAGLTGALLLDAVGQMVPLSTPGAGPPSPTRGEGRTPVPAAATESSPTSPLSRMRERGRVPSGRGEGAAGEISDGSTAPGFAGQRAERFAALAVVGLAAVLALTVRALPREPGGLTAEVGERLEESGVAHPVTAVLLNFRAYDTWLEVGVLLLAVLAALTLLRAHDLTGVSPTPTADPLLGWVARLLLPLMVLVGGYLLWLGTHAPGGAFQAGAVLAAGGVVLLLAGHRSVAMLAAPALRIALVAGFAAFLLAAGGTLLAGRRLLEFQPAGAGGLILLIELAVTVSIACTLAALFAAARPSPEPGS